MQKKSWNMFLKAAEAVRQLLVNETPFRILRSFFFQLTSIGQYTISYVLGGAYLWGNGRF